MHESCDHVIVFGASFAGLLTARVLAEFCKQVTVVERDALPPAGQQRKGVPHGRHVHGLHPRGRVIGLKDRPEGLMRPDRMLRVLRGNLRRPARPGEAASPRSGTPAAL